MWTSERNRNLPVGEAAAEVGTVTLGGDPAGVSVGGERRWLNVYGPGGYSWRPTSGDKVMVLKAGAEGESPCILGTTQDAEGLKPGEVRLTGVDCKLLLGQGQVEITGRGGSLRLGQGQVEVTGRGGSLSLGQEQVELTGGENSLRLSQNGLELSGGLRVGGRTLEEIVRDIVQEIIGQAADGEGES